MDFVISDSLVGFGVMDGSLAPVLARMPIGVFNDVTHSSGLLHAPSGERWNKFDASPRLRRLPAFTLNYTITRKSSKSKNSVYLRLLAITRVYSLCQRQPVVALVLSGL